MSETLRIRGALEDIGERSSALETKDDETYAQITEKSGVFFCDAEIANQGTFFRSIKADITPVAPL
jgi:hypothetical protein